MAFVLRIQLAMLSNLRNLCLFSLYLILRQLSTGEFEIILGKRVGQRGKQLPDYNL